jgi:hypothetical protein
MLPDPAQPVLDLPTRIGQESASLMTQVGPAVAAVILGITLIVVALNLLRKAT